MSVTIISNRGSVARMLLVLSIMLSVTLYGGVVKADRHIFVGLHRNGVAGVTGLLGARGVGISPDGANVYVGSGGLGLSIVTFSRGPTTGGLGHVETFPSGAGRFAVSPDGIHVYAIDGSNVEVYGRDGGAGTLALVEEEPGISNDVDISGDGLHVYVAGGNLLQAYSRNGGTGELTFIEQHQDGISGVDGLAQSVAVAIAPDGGHVYVAGQNDNAIAVFGRDAGTGQLTFVEFQQDSMGGVDGLFDVQGVRVSPDDDHVYGSGDDGVAVFTRNTTTGALTFVEYEPFGSRGRLAISPDGAHVYVTAPGALAVYTRDSGTGDVTLEDLFLDNQGGFDGLGSANDVVVSPDSRHVYVAAGESTVAAFQRINVACTATPLGGCFEPTLSEKALLVVKDDTLNDAKDKLVFKWLKGEAVTVGDFGDPATTANDYALCVYDATANPQPIAELLAPAGGGCGKAADGGGVACWKALSTKGFGYRRQDTHPDGVVAAKLLAGAAGSAKIIVKAKKAFTPTPAVPLGLPVTVQLQNADGGCWTATYSTALTNENGFFKAKAD